MPTFRQSRIEAAYAHLKDVDSTLAAIFDDWPVEHGWFWHGGDLFDRLVAEICYQGITGASADAAHRKLKCSLGLGQEEPTTPELILEMTEAQFRTSGLAGRKWKYLRDLANRVQRGDLVLEMDHLDGLSETELVEALSAVYGIGPVTINHYRRYTLGHLDVIYPGGKAIQRGLQIAYRLSERPDESKAAGIMAAWSPYRAVGQWHMWMLGSSNPE